MSQSLILASPLYPTKMTLGNWNGSSGLVMCVGKAGRSRGGQVGMSSRFGLVCRAVNSTP